MSDKGTKQMLFMLNRAGVTVSGSVGELEFGGGKVRQGVELEVAPHVFDGVQFGSIGRERKDVETLLLVNEYEKALETGGFF